MQFLVNTLAVLSFLMSAITWTVTVIRHKIKLDVEVLDYESYSCSCQFYLRITNNSALPLVIHSIAVTDGKCSSACYLQEKTIRVIDDLKYQSPLFPVNLAAFQGMQVYLVFQDFPDLKAMPLAPDKTVRFEICSNRGVIKQALCLGSKSCYLHSRSRKTNQAQED